ncbi:hypothetical protein HRD49_20390 [Corallococcus exiguus]|uniref:Uncharacterized protein n=1 Tax=Corallococcus exiguus TaxID=83462 RepID=A0A7Y1RJH8_9BACT|nr:MULTISPECIES: hypothetical protein [Corallococcus]RKI35712.1 hypothetical protein D7Y27_30595 [Corallococcus sp. AB004]NBC39781.1 hypothetical protein [Corallococcus exiguus]NNB85433.1 hypothetical protein [Corallococcus exiguus]NNC03358.1 hypothetical protein [Corallococcus exiguus]NNC17734.1 hypothetical protein [Corallococcus exiguus]
MKASRLKQTIPGFALIIGIMAGTALAMVPGSTAETTDNQTSAVQMICSRTCKPCSTQMECGTSGGSCGVWRCTQP